ncbi:MAG: hypothetical protein EZS28_037679, partial [Streblomastix strix]
STDSIASSELGVVSIRGTIHCLLLVGCLDLSFVCDWSGALPGGPGQFVQLNNGPR